MIEPSAPGHWMGGGNEQPNSNNNLSIIHPVASLSKVWTLSSVLPRELARAPAK